MGKIKTTAKYAGIVIASLIIGANIADTEPETVTKTVTEKVTDDAAVQKVQNQLEEAKDQIQALTEENESLVAEASAAQAEKDAQEEKKKEDAKKAAAKPMSLGAGKFIVGEDIQPGRYVVSTQQGGGNFFVFNESGYPEVNEMLGTDADWYVNNITVELEKGQTIEISGLNAVNFKLK